MKPLIKQAGIGSVLVATLLLAGCAEMNNTQGGTITGAVVGGIVGNQIGKGLGNDVATVAGAVLGGYIGGQVGAQMDANDRAYVGQAINTGRPVAWQNPTTGARYNARPGPVYRTNNAVCRPVTVVGYIDGRQQNVQMRACQSRNGQWQAVN
jgi:uncharacterized protein YcfJ